MSVGAKVRLAAGVIMIVVTLALVGLSRLTSGQTNDSVQYVILLTLSFGLFAVPIGIGLDAFFSLLAVPFRLRQSSGRLVSKVTLAALVADVALLVLGWLCGLALVFGR